MNFATMHMVLALAANHCINIHMQEALLGKNLPKEVLKISMNFKKNGSRKIGLNMLKKIIRLCCAAAKRDDWS